MGGMLIAAMGAASPLSVSLSPTSLYTTRVGNGSVTSAAVTATASGGTGYTYAWTLISGNSYTINSPAAAATTFTTTVSVGFFKSGVYRCTVTDSLGRTAYAEITVEFEAL